MPDEALHLPLINRILALEKDTPGSLLPILHAIQQEAGYIPSIAVPEIAQALNLSKAEVQGVISFYHDFRTTPPAQHILRLCQAESCQSMGSGLLAAQLKERLSLNESGNSADARVSLQTVYCLGACACSPAMEIDGRLHARLTPERLDDLVNRCLEGQAC